MMAPVPGSTSWKSRTPWTAGLAPVAIGPDDRSRRGSRGRSHHADLRPRGRGLERRLGEGAEVWRGRVVGDSSSGRGERLLRLGPRQLDPVRRVQGRHDVSPVAFRRRSACRGGRAADLRRRSRPVLPDQRGGAGGREGSGRRAGEPGRGDGEDPRRDAHGAADRAGPLRPRAGRT